MLYSIRYIQGKARTSNKMNYEKSNPITPFNSVL
ncbi:MAG: hypothetical protein ACI87N_003241 [Flavobacteriales bacterium]|jgi:hypothetical protein